MPSQRELINALFADIAAALQGMGEPMRPAPVEARSGAEEWRQRERERAEHADRRAPRRE